MLASWHTDVLGSSSYVLLWVFRAGEICVPRSNCLNIYHGVTWLLTVPQPPPPPHNAWKFIKNRSARKGCGDFYWQDWLLIVPGNGSDVLRGHEGGSNGPFFKFQPLTKPYFTRHVCENLKTIGSPESNFTGYSFHIRAATAAANVGIKDSTIHALGQWSSSAFLAYICTSWPLYQPAAFVTEHSYLVKSVS